MKNSVALVIPAILVSIAAGLALTRAVRSATFDDRAAIFAIVGLVLMALSALILNVAP